MLEIEAGGPEGRDFYSRKGAPQRRKILLAWEISRLFLSGLPHV